MTYKPNTWRKDTVNGIRIQKTGTSQMPTESLGLAHLAHLEITACRLRGRNDFRDLTLLASDPP